MSPVQITREELAIIRLARYRKRAAVERAAARKRQPRPRKITGGKPHAPSTTATGGRRSIRQFGLHLIGYKANQLPPLSRVNAFLAPDQLELRPVLDGLDDLRAPDARGKHIIHYELREPGAAGRRKIGVVSKTFFASLARTHPGKVAATLDVKERAALASRRRNRP